MEKFGDLFELTTLVDEMMGENCYVLQKKGTLEALIIDPGFQTDEVLALMREKGLTCDLALITHGHVDHVSGVTKVADLPTSSWDDLVESIQKKLFSLPPEVVVLAGHAEPTSNGEEKAENPFVGSVAS